MRLMMLLVRLLMMRWLPFGFVLNWMIRLSAWIGLGMLAARALQPRQASSAALRHTPAPSGWTEAARAAAAPEPPAPPVAAQPAAAGPAEAESITVTVEVETAVPEAIEVAAGGVGETTTSIEEAAYVPRWVKGDGSDSCPPSYPVKAKATSLIFHEPGGRHYEATIPDVCFASAEDAAAAGYRAPLR
jgi:hypothetical protein